MMGLGTEVLLIGPLLMAVLAAGLGPLGRALVAFALVAGVWAIGPADHVAADPEVCGYVRYSPNDTDPTQTVPYIPYCGRPCGGDGVWVPPGEVNDIHHEALVCVRGL